MSNLANELCYCLAARRSARYLSRLNDRHLAQANISVSQFSILVSLSDYPNSTLSSLAKLMVMERTTLVRALKPLQNSGYIVSRAEGKRGALSLALSASGAAKVAECLPYWQAAQEEYEALIGVRTAISIRESLLASVEQG